MNAISCSIETLVSTIAVLRRGGQLGHEHMALWLASTPVRSPSKIVEVYEPDQIAEADWFKLPATSMQSLMAHLGSTRRRIVAQIHTHPEEAYHSKVDNEWAIIRHVGALSLVLPRFAASTTPENFLEEVVVYEYSAGGEWCLVPASGPDARISVVA